MAKTRHNNLLDTIDDVLTHAKEKGIIHLYTEDDFFTGRTITVKGRTLYHFGTTGYLGLEQDIRLKKAAVDAIMKYGTQFPLSKSYISHTKYKELEEHLEAMFETPVIVAKNSTLAHIAAIPTIVRDDDAVILDHQVHYSVQNACQLLKPRGIPVEMIRHNNLEVLEDRLKKLRQKHNKIYYMADGVYSMYGDVSPIPELIKLTDKYEFFHIYVDDVHGMSWSGKHGTGYVKSVLPDLHPNVILISTLSKTFGANGGTITIPDKETLRKVKTFGGPLTFSAQLDPASVGAAIASAKIHLSDEIYDMQNELMSKVAFCNEMIASTNLPLMDHNNCPVFFIAVGLPSTGYNLVNRIMQEGFYVNLGVFPAVPIKNTGIRFTISRHNDYDDIKGLIQAMDYHYPKELQDEGISLNAVRKSFRMPLLDHVIDQINPNETTSLNLEYFNSIEMIDQEVWDNLLGANGIFDHSNLKLLEKVFKNNEKKEDNWEFHYIIVKENDQAVLSTFFTSNTWKEDMLSPCQLSKQIEEQRKNDPYYLTSKVLGMGSLITEGEHLYLDKNNANWSLALIKSLSFIADLQQKTGSSMIVLRDFDESDAEINSIFLSQGYVKTVMPDGCTIESFNHSSIHDYLKTLSSNSRKHLKRDVMKHIDYLKVEFKDSLDNDEIDTFYKFYKDVVDINFDISTFHYPKKLLELINSHLNWKFIIIRLKENNEIVAISANYINSHHIMTGVFCGLNYKYLDQYKIYKQLLYQTVLLGHTLKSPKLYMGFSASIEKKKLGATIVPKVAYLQTTDNYKIELLETLANSNQG
jgi:7-keto-8-aminopelargonate synthetase-like enzyme/predicted N-acyltransferase